MNDVTIAIQAGGKSSRMGTDKSFVMFNGRAMIEIVLEKVADLGSEIILITNKPDNYRQLGVPLYPDILPEKGPLGGIYTAVAKAQNPHTLIVACDMPWLNRDLLEYQIGLRNEADIIVPRWQKFPEPLHAIYNKACLPAIEENLEADRLKITSFFGKVTVRFVERAEIKQYDSDGRCFRNVNTPADLDTTPSV